MMKFTEGQIVKAFVQLGSQKEKSWQKVKYVKSLPNNEYEVEYHGQFRTVDSQEIAYFNPIDQKLIEQLGRDEIDELYNQILLAIKALNLSEMAGEVTKQADDYIINLMGGSITVQPGYHETRSIVRFQQVPCWTVSIWKYIPSTRHEPEDVEEIDAGFALSLLAAAKLAVKTVFEMHSNAYFRELDEVKAYEAMKDFDTW